MPRSLRPFHKLRKIQPDLPASYLITKDTDDTINAINGTTGEVEYSGTDAATVIQNALNALTSGRTWKEKVVLKGNFELTEYLRVASYTILEINGQLKASDNFQTADTQLQRLIVGSNLQATTPRPMYIDIIGGTLDGNKANQPISSMNIILFFNGSHINISGTLAINSTSRGVTIDNCEDSVLLNVRAESNDGDGFLIVNSPSVNLVGCLAVNNGEQGIYVSEEAALILGGLVYDNGLDGIHLRPSSPELKHSWYGRIIGTHIRHNNGNGVRLLAEGGYATYYTRIIGCEISFNQNYGIYEDSGCNFNTFAFNYVAENGVGAIVTNGANTIVKDNIGYVTENNGTATIANGAASIVVAHGLAAAPTVVTLGAKHAEVADAIWSADATNITITVPSAVTADREISWCADTRGKVILGRTLTDAYDLADALSKNI